MSTYIGNLYGFQVNQQIAGTDFNLVFSNTGLPSNAVSLDIKYRNRGTADVFTVNSGAPVSPRTWTIPIGDYEYIAEIFYPNGAQSELISFTLLVMSGDNLFMYPFLNPVGIVEAGFDNLPKYYTRNFQQFGFDRRREEWQQYASWKQPWFTGDIIPFHFQSTFDPIIVQLVDEATDLPVITLPSLIGLQNLDNPLLYSFNAYMSLGSVPDGCYYIKITAGTGIGQKIYRSIFCQTVSATPVANTIWIDYKDSKPFYKDIMWVSGWAGGVRLPGWIDTDGMVKLRKDESYRDEKYNPVVLTSKTSRQYPVHIGDFYGVPSDIYNFIDEVMGCDTVIYDNILMGLPDGNKIEVQREENYRLMGVTALLEEGLHRDSRVFGVVTDTTKRLAYGIAIDKKVFGDTSNQGSSNTVPLIKVE